MTTAVVAGAGIAGLAAALALAEAGTDVTIYERAPALRAAGAGLQLAPNATRVLARMGLLDRLRDTAVRIDRLRIRLGRNGTELAGLPFGAEAEARFGMPFLVIHRADLQAVLLDGARAHPAISIETGLAVAGFASEGHRVRVSLRPTDGAGAPRTVVADALVGADGIGSAIRAALAGAGADDRLYCGRTAWRALVPADAASPDARAPNSNLWLGRNAHLVHYPVRGGALVNIVAIVGDGWRGEPARDIWAVPGDPAKIAKAYGRWNTEARTLIAAAPEWRVWPLFDRPPLARWSAGPVTLAGDAAHPMLPFLAQGAGQALEDGWALGEAMRQQPGNIEAAFAAYEASRRDKAGRVQRASRRQGVVYHLGRPASMVRDLAIRSMGTRGMLARYDWLYGG